MRCSAQWDARVLTAEATRTTQTLAQPTHELLTAAVRGERAAQRELYDAFAPLVFGICLRYGRSRAEAQDFSQETWLMIFRKLDRYAGAGSFEGWLRRVTANCCLSGLRATGLTFTELPPVLPTGLHVDPTALSELGAAELAAHVASLPEGYRLVFNLVAVEGFSHAEAAEALGISESSSRSQLTRARAALQRCLTSQKTQPV